MLLFEDYSIAPVLQNPSSICLDALAPSFLSDFMSYSIIISQRTFGLKLLSTWWNLSLGDLYDNYIHPNILLI